MFGPSIYRFVQDFKKKPPQEPTKRSEKSAAPPPYEPPKRYVIDDARMQKIERGYANGGKVVKNYPCG